MLNFNCLSENRRTSGTKSVDWIQSPEDFCQILSEKAESSFQELANNVHWKSGSYKERRRVWEFGGWLQFGGVFPAQKADVWPTPGNSLFSYFSLFPHSLGEDSFNKNGKVILRKSQCKYIIALNMSKIFFLLVLLLSLIGFGKRFLTSRKKFNWNSLW